MISFGTLPFTESAKQAIEASAMNYWRMARIDVSAKPEVDPDGILSLYVEIAQKELVNDRILNDQELLQRARAIFTPDLMPEEQRIYFTAFTYQQ